MRGRFYRKPFTTSTLPLRAAPATPEPLATVPVREPLCCDLSVGTLSLSTPAHVPTCCPKLPHYIEPFAVPLPGQPWWYYCCTGLLCRPSLTSWLRKHRGSLWPLPSQPVGAMSVISEASGSIWVVPEDRRQSFGAGVGMAQWKGKAMGKWQPMISGLG